MHGGGIRVRAHERIFPYCACARGNHGLVHETSLHFACMHSLGLGKCHRCGAAFGCCLELF